MAALGAIAAAAPAGRRAVFGPQNTGAAYTGNYAPPQARRFPIYAFSVFPNHVHFMSAVQAAVEGDTFGGGISLVQTPY